MQHYILKHLKQYLLLSEHRQCLDVGVEGNPLRCSEVKAKDILKDFILLYFIYLFIFGLGAKVC